MIHGFNFDFWLKIIIEEENIPKNVFFFFLLVYFRLIYKCYKPVILLFPLHHQSRMYLVNFAKKNHKFPLILPLHSATCYVPDANVKSKSDTSDQ